MPRKLSFGNTRVVVISQATVRSADREVEANNPEVFVEYPDGTTGTEVAMIMKESSAVLRAIDELNDEEEIGEEIEGVETNMIDAIVNKTIDRIMGERGESQS